MNEKLFKQFKKPIVEALMKNKRKARNQMREFVSSGNGRCCLCVIQDTVDGKTASCEFTRTDAEELHGDSISKKIFGRSNPALPYPVLKSDGSIVQDVNSASCINDGDGVPEFSHKKIAQLFQNLNILPSRRKYSFYLDDDSSKFVHLKKPMTLKQMQTHINSKKK